MLIHILPEVKGAVLIPSLESYVIQSGNSLTRNLDEASVVIGTERSDWIRVMEPAEKVVLKDVLSNAKVPTSATLFDTYTLRSIDDNTLIADWLRDLKDPLNV